MKTIQQKIKEILDERGLNYKELTALVNSHIKGTKCSYQRIIRNLNNDSPKSEMKETLIKLIATGLDLTPEQLKKGTDIEESVKIYKYSENGPYLKFLDEKLRYYPEILEMNGETRTHIDQDPGNLNKEFTKFIFVYYGEIRVTILHENKDPEIVDIKREESFSFDSTIRHYFENRKNYKSFALVVHDPKRL